jgi:hypothetical protein
MTNDIPINEKKISLENITIFMIKFNQKRLTLEVLPYYEVPKQKGNNLNA